MNRKTFLAYGMRLLGAFGAALFTFMIAKLTSPEFVGEYQLTLTLALGLSILMRGGMDRGMVRFVAQTDYIIEQRHYLKIGFREVFKKTGMFLVIGILLSISVYDLSGLSFSMVLSVLISFSMLASGYFKGKFRPNISYLYEMGLVSLIAAIISLVFYLVQREDVFYYALFLSYGVVLFAFYVYLSKGAISSYPENKNLIGEFRSVSHGFMQMTFVVYLQQMLIVFCLSYYLSNHDLGVYKVAERIAFTAGFFQSVIAAIYSPYFSRLYKKGDMQGLRSKVVSAYKMSFIVSFPFVAVILLAGNKILGFFGEDYVAGSHVLMILTLAQFFNVVLSVGGILLNQTDFVSISKRVVLILSIAVLPFVILLSAIYGAVGAAFSVLLYFLLLNLTLTYFSIVKIRFAEV